MLKGKKIHLRLAKSTDLEDYIRLNQDMAARGPFFPMFLQSESTIRQRFQEHGFWSDDFQLMLIVDATTDKMLGTVAAFKPVFYQDSVEIGYILHDVSRRGEGIMAEAVTLFCGYLFKAKNIFRIQLQIEPDNIASVRTAEKAGFTREGVLRQCLISRGEPRDMVMFSMLRSEFEKTNDH